MASFISALALFILILSNGCFTLPINDEQLWNSTFSSLNNSTNEQTFNLQLVSENETSVFLNTQKNGPSDEHIGFEISTSVENLSAEKASQASPTFDNIFTSEATITTEKYSNNKRDYDDSWLSSSEPTSYTTEQSNSDKRDYDDSLSSSEPTTYTTEPLHSDNRDYDDLSFTTAESTTQITGLERRAFENESETESGTETETDKREIQVELTTNDTLSFTSTSSDVAPAFYTSESSTSTSTEKYIGLLKYENEHQDEQEQEQPIKYVKTQRKTTPKSELMSTKKSKVQSEEDSKEATPPTAVFDQEALKTISNIPNDFLILDENNTLVVTDLPEKLSTSTIKNKKEQKPLNQGSTLLLFLLAALLFCACVMASTLAFVKNRYTLKRKSRITEMEAHLDEHYQHYSHPFMFQQHHEKQ